MNQQSGMHPINNPPALIRSPWQIMVFLAMTVMVMMPGRGLAELRYPITVNSNAKTDSLMDAVPVIARGVNGTLVAVWQSPGPNSLNPNGTDIATGNNTNEDIFYARSTDDGKTWSAKAPIKTNAASDHDDDVCPSIATDGHGQWMVVWSSKDSLNKTIGFDSDILMTISSDDGLTWSPPAAVNNDAASDPGGGNGIPSRYAGDHYPMVVNDGLENWGVCWIRFDNRTDYFRSSTMVARSNDGGAHWTDAQALHTRDEPPATDVPFLVANQQNWIICWPARAQPTLNHNILYAVSADSGASWSMPTILNTNYAEDHGDNTAPTIATDSNGRWLAAWQCTGTAGSTMGTDGDIFFSLSDNNGQTWMYPKPINQDAGTDTGFDTTPKVIWDGQNKWVVGWRTNKLGGDDDFVYATMPIGEIQWSAAKPLNAWASFDQPATSDAWLQLAPGAPGRWLAIWGSTWNIDQGKPGDNCDLCMTLFDPDFSPAPNITVMPAALKFTKGNPPTSATLTIKNTGSSLLTLSGAQVTGPHAKDCVILRMPAIPAELAPNASSTVAIQFKPGDTATDFSQPGSLILYSNDPDQPALTVPMTGETLPAEWTGFTFE